MTASVRQKPRSAPQTQTIGSILHDLLPTLFPSRRIPVLAKPVLHGAAVPLGTGVEDLVRCGGGYADGWVCVVVYMVG
jgi:autophagy-related protein 5